MLTLLGEPHLLPRHGWDWAQGQKLHTHAYVCGFSQFTPATSGDTLASCHSHRRKLRLNLLPQSPAAAPCRPSRALDHPSCCSCQHAFPLTFSCQRPGQKAMLQRQGVLVHGQLRQKLSLSQASGQPCPCVCPLPPHPPRDALHNLIPSQDAPCGSILWQW